jgi:hypothetical protein
MARLDRFFGSALFVNNHNSKMSRQSSSSKEPLLNSQSINYSGQSQLLPVAGADPGEMFDLNFCMK